MRGLLWIPGLPLPFFLYVNVGRTIGCRFPPFLFPLAAGPHAATCWDSERKLWSRNFPPLERQQ